MTWISLLCSSPTGYEEKVTGCYILVPYPLSMIPLPKKMKFAKTISKLKKIYILLQFQTGQINFGEEEDEVIVTEILRTSQIANGGGINTGPPQSNGIGQTVTADEIELTLERQPMEEDKTTGGIMDFPEDEAVVHLSASKRDQNDGEMILY